MSAPWWPYPLQALEFQHGRRISPVALRAVGGPSMPDLMGISWCTARVASSHIGLSSVLGAPSLIFYYAFSIPRIYIYTRHLCVEYLYDDIPSLPRPGTPGRTLQATTINKLMDDHNIKYIEMKNAITSQSIRRHSCIIIVIVTTQAGIMSSENEWIRPNYNISPT